MNFWIIAIVLVILALPFLLSPLRRWIYHVLVSIILLLAYAYAVFFLSDMLSEIALGLAILLFVPIVITAICYLTEDELRDKEEESFYDGRLFFRYGIIVKRDIIPIGTKDGTTEEQMAEYVNSIYVNLFERLDSKFGKDPRYFRKIIQVKDSNRRVDNRYFIKVMFDTLRGSTLTIMINSKKIGDQLVVTSLSYIRCTPSWYQGLLFVSTAPFHYWFWIYHWVYKKFSILSFIGKNITNNSFDIIDLEGYLKSSTFTLLTCIESFARDNDLLTEELRQVIVQQISNTQNINIAKSRGVNIGNVQLSAQKLRK